MATSNVAQQKELVTFGIHSLHHPMIEQFLADSVPDIVCVACFPWRIPMNLLRIPTHGFVNLHPSMLPAYRGPAPLFWQLQAGVTQSGITLHRMASTLDSGDIIGQRRVLLVEGADGPTLDRNYAQIGAELLCEFLATLATDRHFKSTPQLSGGSYNSWPQQRDFKLDRAWSARHAYNFMRGTAEWQRPYRCDIGGVVYTLISATGYESAKRLPQQIVETETGVAIQCNPGVLYAQTNGNRRVSLEIIGS